MAATGKHHLDSAGHVNSAQSQSSKLSARGQVSLGKLSFKQRLEAYYSVVHPDLIACPTKWGTRFDQIWDKFGGAVEGEQLLASKLMKKYGQKEVCFETATPITANKKIPSSHRSKISRRNTSQHPQHPNEWYTLNEKESNSGCLDFLSDRFDPVAALQHHNTYEVEALNQFIRTVPILDRVDQFRSYLPICDPLYQPKINNINSNNGVDNLEPSKIDCTGSLEPKSQLKTVKANDNSTLRQVPPCFIETVKWHETGPYSLLYEALLNQQRIRVLVRYVNSIRGTLTGYVTAFDQHMNLLLRDVDEQYCPRRTTNEDQLNTKITHQDVESLSNAQAEVQRRIGCLSQTRDDFGSHTSSQQQEQQKDSKGGTWMLRQRHMSQIMVRGDVIVLIYKASEERSACSFQTNGSSIDNTFTLLPKYRNVEPPCIHSRIGTPGSCIIPNQQRQNGKFDRNRRKQDYTRGFSSNKSDYKSKF